MSNPLYDIAYGTLASPAAIAAARAARPRTSPPQPQDPAYEEPTPQGARSLASPRAIAAANAARGIPQGTPTSQIPQTAMEAAANPGANPLTPPQPEQSLGAWAGTGTLNAVAGAANLLDLPGSVGRDLVTLLPGGPAPRNPFDQLLDPTGKNAAENRIEGRQILRDYGLVSRKKDTWNNFAAGIALEVVTDPLTYLGGFGLTKVGETFAKMGVKKLRPLAKEMAELAGPTGKWPTWVGGQFAKAAVTGKQVLKHADNYLDKRVADRVSKFVDGERIKAKTGSTAFESVDDLPKNLSENSAQWAIVDNGKELQVYKSDKGSSTWNTAKEGENAGKIAWDAEGTRVAQSTLMGSALRMTPRQTLENFKGIYAHMYGKDLTESQLMAAIERDLTKPMRSLVSVGMPLSRPWGELTLKDPDTRWQKWLDKQPDMPPRDGPLSPPPTTTAAKKPKSPSPDAQAIKQQAVARGAKVAQAAGDKVDKARVRDVLRTAGYADTEIADDIAVAKLGELGLLNVSKGKAVFATSTLGENATRVMYQGAKAFGNADFVQDFKLAEGIATSWAKITGKNADEYFAGLNIETGTLPEGKLAAYITRNGEQFPVDYGPRLIQVAERSDGTKGLFMHELGHDIENMFREAGDDILNQFDAIVQSKLPANTPLRKDRKWTVEASEALAEALEEYKPTAANKGILAPIIDILKSVKEWFVGTGKTPNAQIKKFLDDLTSGKLPKSEKKALQAGAGFTKDLPIAKELFDQGFNEEQYISDTKLGLSAVYKIGADSISVAKNSDGKGGFVYSFSSPQTPVVAAGSKATATPSYGGVTQEAADMLSKLNQSTGAMPAMFTRSLEKIAKENGIEITGSMTPKDVINALRAKASSKPSTAFVNPLLQAAQGKAARELKIKGDIQIPGYTKQQAEEELLRINSSLIDILGIEQSDAVLASTKLIKRFIEAGMKPGILNATFESMTQEEAVGIAAKLLLDQDSAADQLLQVAYHGASKEWEPERLIKLPDGTEQYIKASDELPDGAEITKEFPKGRFNLGYVSTGEGRGVEGAGQAYGFGAYFADAESLARHYRKTVAGDTTSILYKGKSISYAPDDIHSVATLMARGTSFDKAKNEIAEELAKRIAESRATKSPKVGGLFADLDITNLLEKRLNDLRSLSEADIKIGKPGAIYKVELPEDDVLMYWDKPLSQQHPKVQEALKKLGIGGEKKTEWTPGVTYDRYNGDNLIHNTIAMRAGYNKDKAKEIAEQALKEVDDRQVSRAKRPADAPPWILDAWIIEHMSPENIAKVRESIKSFDPEQIVSEPRTYTSGDKTVIYDTLSSEWYVSGESWQTFSTAKEAMEYVDSNGNTTGEKIYNQLMDMSRRESRERVLKEIEPEINALKEEIRGFFKQGQSLEEAEAAVAAAEKELGSFDLSPTGLGRRSEFSGLREWKEAKEEAYKKWREAIAAVKAKQGELRVADPTSEAIKLLDNIMSSPWTRVGASDEIYRILKETRLRELKSGEWIEESDGVLLFTSDGGKSHRASIVSYGDGSDWYEVTIDGQMQSVGGYNSNERSLATAKKIVRQNLVNEHAYFEDLMATAKKIDSIEDKVTKASVSSFQAKKTASKKLASAGIIGNKVPANHSAGGNSRGRYNFVIFDDRFIDVLDRLPQLDGTSIKGLTTFDADGKAIVQIVKGKGDVSTAVHEIVHVMLRNLSDVFQKDATSAMEKQFKNIHTIKNILGKKPEDSLRVVGEDGRWTRDAEEAFARLFERWVYNGQAPEGLAAIFKKLAKAMRSIYSKLKGSPIDSEINPELKRVFEKMLNADKRRVGTASQSHGKVGDPIVNKAAQAGGETVPPADNPLAKTARGPLAAARAGAVADATTPNVAQAPVADTIRTNEIPGSQATNATLSPGVRLDTEPNPAAFSDLTRMNFGEPISIVARSESGEEIGRITYMPKGGPIDVFVKESERRKGVGTALYDAAEKAGAKIPSEDSGFAMSREAELLRAKRQADTIRTQPDVADNTANAYLKSNEFKSKFGDWENSPELASKVTDKSTGKPLIVYHGTTASDFDSFKTSSDNELGTHFGSKEQANDLLRIRDEDAAITPSERLANTAKFGSNKRIIAAYLDIKNPARLPDPGAWKISNIESKINANTSFSPGAKTEEIYDRKILDAISVAKKAKERHASLNRGKTGYKESQSESLGLKTLREELENAGYDGVVYKNTFEGDAAGDSYIIFKPNQVVQTNKAQAPVADTIRTQPDVAGTQKPSVSQAEAGQADISGQRTPFVALPNQILAARAGSASTAAKAAPLVKETQENISKVRVASSGFGDIPKQDAPVAGGRPVSEERISEILSPPEDDIAVATRTLSPSATKEVTDIADIGGAQEAIDSILPDIAMLNKGDTELFNESMRRIVMEINPNANPGSGLDEAVAWLVSKDQRLQNISDTVYGVNTKAKNINLSKEAISSISSSVRKASKAAGVQYTEADSIAVLRKFSEHIEDLTKIENPTLESVANVTGLEKNSRDNMAIYGYLVSDTGVAKKTKNQLSKRLLDNTVKAGESGYKGAGHVEKISASQAESMLGRSEASDARAAIESLKKEYGELESNIKNKVVSGQARLNARERMREINDEIKSLEKSVPDVEGMQKKLADDGEALKYANETKESLKNDGLWKKGSDEAREISRQIKSLTGKIESTKKKLSAAAELPKDNRTLSKKIEELFYAMNSLKYHAANATDPAEKARLLGLAQEARNKIAESNQGLIVKKASELAGGNPGNIQDNITSGNIAILDLIEKHNFIDADGKYKPMSSLSIKNRMINDIAKKKTTSDVAYSYTEDAAEKYLTDQKHKDWYAKFLASGQTQADYIKDYPEDEGMLEFVLKTIREGINNAQAKAANVGEKLSGESIELVAAKSEKAIDLGSTLRELADTSDEGVFKSLDPNQKRVVRAVLGEAESGSIIPTYRDYNIPTTKVLEDGKTVSKTVDEIINEIIEKAWEEKIKPVSKMRLASAKAHWENAYQLAQEKSRDVKVLYKTDPQTAAAAQISHRIARPSWKEVLTHVKDQSVVDTVLQSLDVGENMIMSSRPMVKLAQLFDRSVLNTGDYDAQEMARKRWDATESAIYGNRLLMYPVVDFLGKNRYFDTKEIATKMIREGKMPRKEAIKAARQLVNSRDNDIRRFLESPLENQHSLQAALFDGNEANTIELQDFLKSLKAQFPKFLNTEQSSGLMSRLLFDVESLFFPRNKTTPGRSLRSKPQGEALMSAKMDSQMGRDATLKHIPDGTAVLNEMSVDEAISGIFTKNKDQSGPLEAGLMAAAKEHVINKYGLEKLISKNFRRGYYNKAGELTTKGKTKLEAIITKIAKLPAAHVETQVPMFGHNFLRDFAGYTESHYTKTAIGMMVQDLVAKSRVSANPLDTKNWVTKLYEGTALDSHRAYINTLKLTDNYSGYTGWAEKKLKNLADPGEGKKPKIEIKKDGSVRVLEKKHRPGKVGLNVPKGSHYRSVDDFMEAKKWGKIYTRQIKLAIDSESFEAANTFLRAWTTVPAVSGMVQIAGAALNTFKSMVTLPFLAFHSRNFLSGHMQNVFYGAFDPTDPLRYQKPVRQALALSNGNVIKGISNEIPRFLLEQDDVIDFVVIKAGTPEADKLVSNWVRQKVFQYGITGDKQGIMAEKITDTVSSLISQNPGAVKRKRGNWFGLQDAILDPTTSLSQKFNPIGFEGGLYPSIEKLPGQGRNTVELRTIDETTNVAGAVGGQLSLLVENVNRIAPMLAFMKQGMLPEEAARMVNRIQFNYSDVSDFERRIAKQLIPFYTFTSKALKLTLGDLVTNPGGKQAWSIRVTNRLQDRDEPIPEHIRRGVAIPLPSGPGGEDRYLSGFGLAWEDPIELTSFLYGDTKASLTSAYSKLRPEIQGAGEAVFGKSAFFGRDLTDMDPQLGRLRDNLVGKERKGLSEPLLGSGGLEMLSSKLPTSRAVSAANTAMDDRKSALDKFLNLATGFKVNTVNEESRDRILMNRYNEIQKEIGAKEMKIMYTPEWLRERLPPEQIDQLNQLKELKKGLDAKRRERQKLDKINALQAAATTPSI